MYLGHRDFPLDLRFSLKKLGETYRESQDIESESLRLRANEIIEILDNHPALEEGISDFKELPKYKKQLDIVFQDLFPMVLQSNEIKIASMPFNESIIQSTKRFKNILTAAGEDFELSIRNFDEDNYYIMGCSIILMQFYKYNIDFRRPFYHDIPDENGIVRHYRILYNGDYIDIEKTDDAPQITQDDVNELLDNFENIELWRSKFPPNSYIFRGFVIANMYDATTDVSLSEFKSGLLKYDYEQDDFTADFNQIFQSIFNLPDLEIGFSNYNFEEGTFEVVPFKDVKSYLLYDAEKSKCKNVLCSGSYETVFNTGDFFAISNVERYHKMDPSVKMYTNLMEQGIRSAIIAPIRHKKKLLGLLEIASPNAYELNSINANKLYDIMPYLVDAVLRDKEQQENEIELIIQNECTSIHPSVYWKFEKEARRFHKAQLEGDFNTQFRDVVFRDVYPLYGQIDIKGSSEARNSATQQDILLQLTKAMDILNEALKIEELPIYEQLIYNLRTYIQEIENVLDVDSERKVLKFLSRDIRPLFSHLITQGGTIARLINEYRGQIEDNLGLVYKFRKAYDDSVMTLNKGLSSYMDKQQRKAQAMYPHFFERYKTDGVEHNMYIGESITKQTNFNKVYLYNLRLWQLQVMCEMENEYAKLSRKLAQPLEMASMILVFNTSLSVRFRMDEKRFDVDGTYNARYEVVKKRVDKAYIKGTEDRITQSGKLAIVYSQKSDEEEYLRYIHFLQSKKYLGNEVEIVELEDLQAVTGLKAIRVNILYKVKSSGANKEYYTYEDLLEEIKS
ncbi:GAF domain-containing protein [Dokdonia sinensis]|uniref:GAF domain-containing protein n=1 Tax=Dokdonia sinensis TaxID=2479847 RepID=A0A3M0G400_9FLAO|nr:GAF domain-containing protein [Dokdonia sinensis]RMB59565.1 GAF domain-containing protein [Dokdonia sinensis]